jgi:hypothetical protein
MFLNPRTRWQSVQFAVPSRPQGTSAAFVLETTPNEKNKRQIEKNILRKALFLFCLNKLISFFSPFPKGKVREGFQYSLRKINPP